MDINTQAYYLSNHSPITKAFLTTYVRIFWEDIFSRLHKENNNIHLMLMCKVEFTDPNLGYKTLGPLRKVNFTDQKLFVEFLLARIGVLSDSYTVNPVSKILFSFLVKNGIADDSRSLLQNTDYEVKAHSYNNLQLPLTMDPNQYGEIIGTKTIDGKTTFIASKENIHIFKIEVDGNKNNVRLMGAADLTWVDTKISDNSFKREFDKNILYIKDGVVVVKAKQLNAKAFRKVPVEKQLIKPNVFMTIDIETILTENNVMEPYLICGYSNGRYIYSYATEISTEGKNAMFNDFIKQMLQFKDVKYVYAHNLSGFDGILLMKSLINFEGAHVEPLIFNDKLMSITFKTKNKKIVFKDSYLLLPNSLRELCKAFSIKTPKTHFPFKLNDINYIGEFPDADAWGMTHGEWKTLRDNFKGVWSFKDESIKYCKIDCKSLFDILVDFNKLVFDNFKVNIHQSLTLPSLSMRIYKSQFMPNETIYKLLGQVEQDIREAYTGGAVDVYKPHNGKDNDFYNPIRAKLKCYDVNSLYPFIMSTMEMPVGKPIAFEGDITKFDPDVYGFLYCKITSPNDLKHPILQRRIKTENGIRTIAGLGTWEGWIMSEEMNKTMHLGYKFEVIRGYKFKRAVIFKDYINKLYNMRLKYPKTNPLNMICKLLMNSLYGKFGMKTSKSVVSIYNTSLEVDRELLESNLETVGEFISDYIKLDNYIITVRKHVENFSYNEKFDWHDGLEVNIAIAATVTAGGRLWMSLLKNRQDFEVYNTDTDSLFIAGDLPKELIGDNLGQFKLEYEIKKAVFLAPKAYSIVTTDDKTITKIKGVTKDIVESIPHHDIEELLVKDSTMEVSQDKWFKKVYEGKISVGLVAYNLKVTANKREAIYKEYHENGKTKYIFSDTKPYYYEDIEIKKVNDAIPL